MTENIAFFHWTQFAFAYSNRSKFETFEKSQQKSMHTSPAGNRTPVSRVTGGDTYHYTTEDWYIPIHYYNSCFTSVCECAWKEEIKSTKSCCKSTRAKLPDHLDSFFAGKDEKLTSPAGNRTPVSRVTGGDTYHYTTEDRYMLNTLAYSQILLLQKHWQNDWKYSVFSLNAIRVRL